MESLSSLVARYAMHTGSTKMPVVYKYFFNYSYNQSYGKDNRPLAFFHNTVKDVWKIEFGDLLKNHTILRFAYPFNKELNALIQSKHDMAVLFSEYDYESLLNINSRYLRRDYRFCRSCVEEDRELFGEAYYKIIHDIPGIGCCLIHGKELQGFRIGNASQHKCWALEYIYDLCDEQVREENVVSQEKIIELEIGKYYFELLRTDNLPFVSIAKWANYYRSQISLNSDEDIGAVIAFASELDKSVPKLFGYNKYFSWVITELMKNVRPKRSRYLVDLGNRAHFSLWFLFCANKSVVQIFLEASQCTEALPYRKPRKKCRYNAEIEI